MRPVNDRPWFGSVLCITYSPLTLVVGSLWKICAWHSTPSSMYTRHLFYLCYYMPQTPGSYCLLMWGLWMLSTRSVWDSCLESDGITESKMLKYYNGPVWLHCPISCPIDASRYLGMWLDLMTSHQQTWLFSSTSTYHSTDLLTARGIAHLVVHGTSGSTSYETVPHIRLETAGDVLSTVDMVVQRRDGPRQLREHDCDHEKIYFCYDAIMPSVLWRCWLGDRKGIRPVKNWVVGYWRGYLSGARCRLAYGPAAWCHCHSLSLASVKSRLVLPFWYRLTRVVLDKGPLNVCSVVV